MKKKLITLVAAVTALCLSAFLIAGCSSNSSKSEESEEATETTEQAAEETAEPEEFTKLVVGFDQEYPPYGYLDENGDYTGFDLDLAREVAERNGWEIELTPIDWDAKDALLNQGTINCIWNGFTMEGREGDYTFTEPYMLNEQVIVTKAGSDIKNFEDLAGKTVITQAGSAAEEALASDEMADIAATFAGGAPQTISDYNQAFMQLESGTVDAVACDLSIAAYQMAAKPDVYVQLEEPMTSEHYAVGFKLGDEDVAKIVSDTLKKMYADGTIAKLVEKYADQGITIDNWVLVDEVSDAAADEAAAATEAAAADAADAEAPADETAAEEAEQNAEVDTEENGGE